MSLLEIYENIKKEHYEVLMMKRIIEDTLHELEKIEEIKATISTQLIKHAENLKKFRSLKDKKGG